MIRSMTGFGDAAAKTDGVSYHVELRSVNNRYFKASLRLPEAVAALEAEMEMVLRRKLYRGSIVLTVKLKIEGELAASRVNDEALLAYLEHLETIQSRLTTQESRIDLTQLLTLPGVLQPSQDEITLMERARPVLTKLVDEAADRLLAMRSAEGRAVADDLLGQLALIRQRMNLIGGRAPAVIEEYHHRLRGRVEELLARAELKFGEVDLIREVALYAERSDISEELSRMAGHLDQFAHVVEAKDDAVGRTLDFIAQEMLREANTIASKSNDTTISRAIVEVKAAIDRIKEQVQNVE
jgi:uncharacterized protein (TIGR00255 family)